MGRKGAKSTSTADRRRARANRAARGARDGVGPAPAAPVARPPSRWMQLAVGFGLGFAWGLAMCAVFYLTGSVDSWWTLASVLISSSLIGSTVAAVFGSVGVRRRGERIGPRWSRRR